MFELIIFTSNINCTLGLIREFYPRLFILEGIDSVSIRCDNMITVSNILILTGVNFRDYTIEKV